MFSCLYIHVETFNFNMDTVRIHAGYLLKRTWLHVSSVMVQELNIVPTGIRNINVQKFFSCYEWFKI